MAESEFGLEIGDDEWWKESEARVVREARRARRRALVRRIATWSPVAAVILLVVAGGTWMALGGRLPETGPAGEAAEVLDLPLTADQLKDPYRGTPAERFGSGPAGFTVPPARRVGRHSAAEVAANLQAAKNLLILTRLDPKMVERRDPSAYLAAVSPRERARSAAELRTPGETATGAILTRLAPGSTQLAPPRFQGTMTVHAGSDGDVEVATDYVFVYALKPSWAVTDRTETHVVVRSQVRFSFTADDRWSDADQGAGVAGSDVFLLNMDCAKAARDLLALPSKRGEPVEGDGSDSTEDLYRADGPLPTGNTCSSTSPSPAASPSPTRRTTNT
jgi:hypothetical protein